MSSRPSSEGMWGFGLGTGFIGPPHTILNFTLLCGAVANSQLLYITPTIFHTVCNSLHEH
jgi:hypothetical protein